MTCPGGIQGGAACMSGNMESCCGKEMLLITGHTFTISVIGWTRPTLLGALTQFSWFTHHTSGRGRVVLILVVESNLKWEEMGVCQRYCSFVVVCLVCDYLLVKITKIELHQKIE